MSALRSCIRTAINVQRLSSVVYTGARGIKRWVAPTFHVLHRRKQKLGPQPEPRRSSFLEWNYAAELFAFNKRLSERFDDALLAQALTHRSYIAQEEQKQKEVGIQDPKLDLKDNTELIEEGAELTAKIVERYLSQCLPKAPEETVIAIYDQLLTEETLARVSTLIGTKDIILCAEHPVESLTLANTFFALVAALSRSVDLEHASIFVRDFLIATLAEKDLAALWNPEQPLKLLNEILAREERSPAEPRLISETGSNTILAVFQVAVYSDKQFLGVGSGESVEIATEMAASDALRRMFELLDSSKPISFNMKIDFSAEQPTQNLPLSRWCSENVRNLVRA